MSKPKIKTVTAGLVGTKVSKDHAVRGTEIHEIIAKSNPSMNHGKGADFPKFDAELKTKDSSSRSAYGIASMSIDDIKNIDYNSSVVKEKLQQQIHVSVNNGTISGIAVYDFRPQWIQDKIEEAYENARALINHGNCENYIYGSKYGYFEKRHNRKTQYQFRITVGAMDNIKKMSTSQVNNTTLFE
jgi:hypothetical protein